MLEQIPATILVVDDEPSLARALDINLRARGYQCLTAANGCGALQAVQETHVDLVLLDLGLPDIDGMSVIAGIRGWSQMPIVVLSARHASDDKVEALDAGANDYVTKPFEMNELLARVRATLRHAGGGQESPVITAGPISVDLANSTVTVLGDHVRLTPTEWRILEMLARHPDALVTQADLLRDIWGPSFVSETQYLRVYLATLRRKLEPDPSHPRYLITEPGLGYRLMTKPTNVS